MEVFKENGKWFTDRLSSLKMSYCLILTFLRQTRYLETGGGDERFPNIYFHSSNKIQMGFFMINFDGSHKTIFDNDFCFRDTLLKFKLKRRLKKRNQ